MKRFSFALTVAIILVACQNEAKVTQNKLLGKWSMDAALRDGVLTETLREAYFYFVDEHTLISNINRRETTYQYNIHDDQIEQTGSMNVTYTVEGMNEDTLVLSAMIRDYNFKFRLIRDTLTQDSLGTIVL